MASPWIQRRRSTIHGEGVFARGFIPKGQIVAEMGGRVVRAEEIYDGMRVMQIGPDRYLAEDDAPDRVDYDENYINHCCEPNLGFAEGSLVLHALRDIEEGEEVFWDYSTSMNEPGWSVPCHCGAPTCRGSIQSFCDLAPSHQRRLLPIALQYLRDLYADKA